MYELKVTGMTCGGCVNSVTNALKTLDSKSEVKVDLKTQMVQVKSEKSKAEVIDAIEEAGFNVSK